MGWAVQRDRLLPRCFAARDVLAFHPPAAGFDRIARVTDVDDHVDVALVAGHSGCQVDVSASWVEVAVGAASPGAVLAEQAGVGRIGIDVPDQYPFVEGFGGVAAPTCRHLLQRRDHLAVVDIHLDGPCVARTFDEPYVLGLLWVSHVDDRPTAMP